MLISLAVNSKIKNYKNDDENNSYSFFHAATLGMVDNNTWFLIQRKKMTNRLLSFFAAIIIVTASAAQVFQPCSASETAGKVFLGVNAGYGASGHKTHFFLGEDLGYRFSRLAVFAHHETPYSLQDHQGTKTYRYANVLGGGVGYTLLTDKAKRFSCSIRAVVGHSVGNTGFNHTLYDAGFFLKFGNGLCPTAGLGFRHASVHAAGQPDLNSAYISIGIGL